MIDDLMLFGYKTNIPRIRPISFLIRMYKAHFRYLEMIFEPLKDIKTKIGGTHEVEAPPLPEHLRPNRRKK